MSIDVGDRLKDSIVRQLQHHGANFYKSDDKLIETSEPGPRIFPMAGDIVQFDSYSWHRGTPARARGFLVDQGLPF